MHHAAALVLHVLALCAAAGLAQSRGTEELTSGPPGQLSLSRLASAAPNLPGALAGGPPDALKELGSKLGASGPPPSWLKGMSSDKSDAFSPPDGLKGMLSSRLEAFSPPNGPPSMFGGSSSDPSSPPDRASDTSSPGSSSDGSKGGKSSSKCDLLGPEAQKAIPAGLDKFFPPGVEKYIPFAILHGQGPPLPASLESVLRSHGDSNLAGAFATPPPPEGLNAEGPPVSKGMTSGRKLLDD